MPSTHAKAADRFLVKRQTLLARPEGLIQLEMLSCRAVRIRECLIVVL